jgi:hypothetical protein
MSARAGGEKMGSAFSAKIFLQSAIALGRRFRKE